MPLREEFENQGNWLFRWRSYLPLALAPLLVGALVDAGFAGQSPAPWDLVCLGISFLGLGVRVLVAGHAPAGTSGRNVAKQEAWSLNRTGMYSAVRHPLYLGNFLMALGVVLFLRSPWFALTFSLLYWLYYERIMFAEEAFLRRAHRAAYEKWAMKTPAVMPCFRAYKPPVLPFSLRTVLRREYPGFFGLAFSFALLASARSFLSAGRVDPGTFWWVFLGVGAVLYLVLRTLKRKTRLLNVSGR